jgi:hypothetical protein
VLFHQPRAERLEVIALTGDPSRPRGSLQFVVEDLNNIKKVSTEKNWQGLPIVGTTFPVPEDWPPPGENNSSPSHGIVRLFHFLLGLCRFLCALVWPTDRSKDVEIDLLLVSKDEVIFMQPGSWVQLKRLAVAEYL